MRFKVLPVPRRPNLATHGSGFFLVSSDWDDWFTYETQHELVHIDGEDRRTSFGQVKIGQFGMLKDQRMPDLPKEFEELDDRFFSLGQDVTYYSELGEFCGEDVREQVLRALRDIAVDRELFSRALAEDVTERSLMRFVRRATVETQFRRVGTGGAATTKYHFTYTPPSVRGGATPTPLEFHVVPGSRPPTNIHVLIGRNGVGKSWTQDHMARALAEPGASPAEVGHFEFEGADKKEGRFINLVSVSFSAFDTFEPISKSDRPEDCPDYAYVGLKTIARSRSQSLASRPLKGNSALAKEFGQSVYACSHGARLVRWRRALQTLESDPIFNAAGIADLTEHADDEETLKAAALRVFGKLSSGHKIVLLTITRLVEEVEERSLVLLDEPEAHLHPPLLSAFTRALSDLLVNRNGVGIIATHSPVILQEVPRTCVLTVRRSGRTTTVDRPELETFGENVGTLTREVFGLEVTQSGFHRLIGAEVDAGLSYDSIVAKFEGQLGGEARALLRALIAVRDAEGGQ